MEREELDQQPGGTDPGDGELVVRLREGDPDALRMLMGRYDRLVRYVVFRLCRGKCAQDPTFLDALSSEAWTGFVQSIGDDRKDPPQNLKTYIAQIARNKATDALRRTETGGHGDDGTIADELAGIESPTPATVEVLIQAEQVLALRECASQLKPADRTLYEHVEDLVAGRWKRVGEALEMPESTVRSRWAAVIVKLRTCLEKKTQENFAAPASDGDP